MSQVLNTQNTNIYTTANAQQGGALQKNSVQNSTTNSIISQNKSATLEDLINKLKKILKGKGEQEFLNKVLENITEENVDIYAKKLANVSDPKQVKKILKIVNDSINLGVNVDKYEEVVNLYKKYELNTNELFDILNKAKTQEEKSKILNTLKSTFEYVLKEVKNPDKNKSLVKKLVEEYSFVQASGVSIEDYKKCANTEFRTLTESKAALIKKYGSLENGIKALHEESKKILDEKIQDKSPEEAKQIKAEFIKEQNAKMLAIVFNSTPEEQVALIENLEMMADANMKPLLEAIKLKINNSDEYAKRLRHYRHPHKDLFGNKLSSDRNRELSQFVSANMDEEGLSKYHSNNLNDKEQFFNENRQEIANIQKYNHGELGRELTEEELKVKEEIENYYSAISAGEIVGTSQNEVIKDKENINKLLEQFVSDAKKYDDYSNVLSQINEMIQNNKDTDYSKLIEKLDSLTNGEFSGVVNSSKTVDTSNNVESAQLGFPQKEKPINFDIKLKTQEFYSKEEKFELVGTKEKHNENITENYNNNLKESLKHMSPTQRFITLKQIIENAGIDTKKRFAQFVANRENLIKHASKFGFSFLIEVYSECNDKLKEKIIKGKAGIVLTSAQKDYLLSMS